MTDYYSVDEYYSDINTNIYSSNIYSSNIDDSEDRYEAISRDLVGISASSFEILFGFMLSGIGGGLMAADSALGVAGNATNLLGHSLQDSDNIHDVVQVPSLFSIAGLTTYTSTGLISGDLITAKEYSESADAYSSVLSFSFGADDGKSAIHLLSLGLDATFKMSGIQFDDPIQVDWDSLLQSADFLNVKGDEESYEWNGIDSEYTDDPSDPDNHPDYQGLDEGGPQTA